MAFGSYDVDVCRVRIAARNAILNAVLEVVDAPLVRDAGPLAGVPYVLKDTWDTAGIVTTGGSWRHRSRVPAASSRVHRAIEETGAVLLGKSNLCDLAFSTESANHLSGPAKNPYDLRRTAGGSTGGGAAAVADGMAAFDWGSDFGGSIRGPAAFCGVVGLRLSAATWPVETDHFPKVAPFFWDMCGMGPIAREVEGARAVVDALAPKLRRPSAKAGGDRVVVWRPDRKHAGAWPTFSDDVRGLGAEADLPSPTEVSALYTEHLAANVSEIIATGELALREGIPAVLLGLLSGGRYDRRVHPNTGVLLLAILALRLRHRDRARTAARVGALRDRVRRIWDTGALIVAPTSTSLPPRHGQAAFSVRLMSFCMLGNLVDATALSVPFGVYAGTGLPRGLQILGPPGSEDAVLDLGERLVRR